MENTTSFAGATKGKELWKTYTRSGLFTASNICSDLIP